MGLIEFRRQKIIEKIKSTKWDRDFKHKVAEGLGYNLTGFTKIYALEVITRYAMVDRMKHAYDLIVKGRN